MVSVKLWQSNLLKIDWIVAASARRENLLNELKLINENIHSFPLDVTEIDKCKLTCKKNY